MAIKFAARDEPKTPAAKASKPADAVSKAKPVDVAPDNADEGDLFNAEPKTPGRKRKKK